MYPAFNRLMASQLSHLGAGQLVRMGIVVLHFG
jgi:uncharacterized protein YjeT (DUF2065 family)